MAKVRYVDFHPDEWIAGTVQLSLPERGLYITACALIYSHGGPVEVDHLRAACRMCRGHGHTFNAALRRLLDLGKLILEGTLIGNERASKELQKSVKRAANSRQNGAKNNKNNELRNPPGVTINHQEEESSLTGRDSSSPMRGANAPTTASSPPMGEAVGLRERGARLIGNRLIIEQQLNAVGLDKVTRALDAVERGKDLANPRAYFIACCRGPAAVANNQPMNREEMERHAAERREAARLECYREAGLCADD